MIAFTKSKLPFGFLGNMSPFSVEYQGQQFRTAEALFQALRFDDPAIIQEIQKCPSPMGAKFVAKANKDKMIVEPASQKDIDNMELVIRLKIEQHPQLQKQLLDTGEEEIIEDVTNRPTGRNIFWGAACKDGKWFGDNILGKLWMKLRTTLRK